MSTIAAIATATTNGGIGIIRMSGKECFTILEKIFKPRNPQKIEEIAGYTMKYGYIINQETKENIDEVIVSYFKSPKSYTTEDMCEINSHGGMVVMRQILDLCLKNGAELAEPGEFTKRAFLNGRIDLSQAEGVIDLINSKTFGEAKASFEQLQGELSKRIQEIRKLQLDIMADIEASIDYPEYDEVGEVTTQKMKKALTGIKEKLIKLEDSYSNGKILKEGIKTVIVGKPNAGKSSLLNAILNEERAIVSEIAGTTRDATDTKFTYHGKDYIMIDTAGIRKRGKIYENIEKYSLLRSMKAIERSDVCVLVIDAKEGIIEHDKHIAGMAIEMGKALVICVNKWDTIENPNEAIKKWKELLHYEFQFATYAKIVYPNNQKKRNVKN